MISEEEGSRALLLGDRYVLQPTIAGWGYSPPEHGLPVPDRFAYRSNTNDLWMTVDDLRKMLGEVD